MTAGERSWDVVTDCLIVGSGGGAMCAALAAVSAGRETLVLEKTDLIGGSTAMSAGVLWLPDNAVSRRAGIVDSRAETSRYVAEVVGHEHPWTSVHRVNAFLDAVDPMLEFLERQGVPFRHCSGYPDYHPDRPGGRADGRSIEAKLFDTARLGAAQSKLRVGEALPSFPAYTAEIAPLTAGMRTVRSLWTVAKVAGRMAAALARGKSVRGSGAALQGWMLLAALRSEVPIWTSTPVTDVIFDDRGCVAGVTAMRSGRPIRILARDGVLLDCGGFAHNEAMRQKYGHQPGSTELTMASPGDTGELLEAVIAHGAATGLMDEAWWLPMSVLPDGSPLFVVWERSKPHGLLVDSSGQRYVNEATPYIEFAKAIRERNQNSPSIPSWWIMDSRHRRRYMWASAPGGFTPRGWLSSGYMLKADTTEELARRCGIDPAGLAQTIERFNSFAAEGKDPDFHKGEQTYDRYWGDPRNRPNPCVGAVDRPPFYAVALYPGDVGTCGGLVTDEHARVMNTEAEPIPGLYATGNCTASIMGDSPAAGASVGASFVFGWIAANHMRGSATVSTGSLGGEVYGEQSCHN